MAGFFDTGPLYDAVYSLCDTIDSARASLPQDSYLQNIVDEIVQLAASTKYKLTYLS